MGLVDRAYRRAGKPGLIIPQEGSSAPGVQEEGFVNNRAYDEDGMVERQTFWTIRPGAAIAVGDKVQFGDERNPRDVLSIDEKDEGGITVRLSS